MDTNKSLSVSNGYLKILLLVVQALRLRLQSLLISRPTHKAYNILLDAFAISGMVEQAKTVFKSMRRDR